MREIPLLQLVEGHNWWAVIPTRPGALALALVVAVAFVTLT